MIAGLGPTAGQRLVTHPGIGKAVFVGSPATGRRIAAAAGEALIPCVLELGGKSANIVFEDADLDRAVHLLVEGLAQLQGPFHIVPHLRNQRKG